MIGLLQADYFLRALYPACALPCYNLHTAILNVTAGSPYRYRVLSALMADVVARNTLETGAAANAAAYTLLHAMMLPLMLYVVWRWLKHWMSDDRAFIAVLVFAVLLPLGFQDYGLSLYTPIEVILFTIALLHLNSQQHSTPLFAILVALATLNRETGILLPLAYLAFTADWKRGAFYMLVWFFVYGALHVILGEAALVGTPADWWRFNTGSWFFTTAINNAFMAPIWIGAALRWRKVPNRLKRLSALIAVYLPLILVFGLWHEVRLQWVMFPILLPIMFHSTAGINGEAE